MRKFLLVVLAALVGAGLVAAGGGGDGDRADNPFRGTWRVEAYGVTVTITDDTWEIPGLGRGTFSWQGDHPDYVVTLTFEGERITGTAHFTDENQFRGCIGGDCALFDRV